MNFSFEMNLLFRKNFTNIPHIWMMYRCNKTKLRFSISITINSSNLFSSENFHCRWYSNTIKRTNHTSFSVSKVMEIKSWFTIKTWNTWPKVIQKLPFTFVLTISRWRGYIQRDQFIKHHQKEFFKHNTRASQQPHQSEVCIKLIFGRKKIESKKQMTPSETLEPSVGSETNLNEKKRIHLQEKQKLQLQNRRRRHVDCQPHRQNVITVFSCALSKRCAHKRGKRGEKNVKVVCTSHVAGNRYVPVCFR